MSEQKYYVKLRQEVFISERCCDAWLSEDYYFSEELFRQSFTKSELAEIMDGALYKGHEMNQDCVFLGCEEWINPLIKLVPVDEV